MKDYNSLYIYENYMALPDFIYFMKDKFDMVITAEDPRLLNPNTIIFNYLKDIPGLKYDENLIDKSLLADFIKHRDSYMEFIYPIVKKCLSTVTIPQKLAIVVLRLGDATD